MKKITRNSLNAGLLSKWSPLHLQVPWGGFFVKHVCVTNKNEISLRGKNKAFLVSFNDIC